MTTTKEELERDYKLLERDMDSLSQENQELRVELMAAKERIRELEEDRGLPKK